MPQTGTSSLPAARWPLDWLPRILLPPIFAALLLMQTALGGEPSRDGEVRGAYIWTKTVRGNFAEVVETIKNAAARKNFPVTKIRNYKESFEKRLEQIGGGTIPYANYQILEICNVMLAIESLRTDARMGIFMPCRMVVYALPGSGEVVLMTVNPHFMPATLKNPALESIADRVEEVVLEIFDAFEF